MKLSEVLALISDESKHESVSAAWKRLADDGFEAGKAEAGKAGREAEKALKEAKAEADRLRADVESLRTTAGDASKAASELATAQKALKALEAERERMRPIVERHNRTTLRESVVKAARLANANEAAALAEDLGIALGDDGALSADHIKALETWAADPVNKSRVSPPPGQQQTTSPHRIAAPPIAGGQPKNDIAAELSRLPAAARPAAEARLRAEGLL